MTKAISINLNPTYKILQYLSLDVAIGSAASSVLAVTVLSVKLPMAYWIILPICVWIIYTTDHLLDANKTGSQAMMGRHLYHFRHKRTLETCLFAAIALVLLLILKFLDQGMIIFGIFAICFIILYLYLNQRRNRMFHYMPRELWIASGYMAGTWGMPLMVKYPDIGRSELIFFAGHFLFILAVPLLYAIYEYDADKASGFISLATVYGTKYTILIVDMVLSMAFLLSGWLYLTYLHPASILLMSMCLVLMAVLAFRHRLSTGEKYRIYGELSTFLPFILLLK